MIVKTYDTAQAYDDFGDVAPVTGTWGLGLFMLLAGGYVLAKLLS